LLYFVTIEAKMRVRIENRRYTFALWPAVGHLVFQRKWIFKSVRSPATRSAPVSDYAGNHIYST